MLTLTTKNKTINLIFRTRKLVAIKNMLKGKNFEEIFFKAMHEQDLDALSKIIHAFAEVEEGKDAFKSNLEVFDFIDDYKIENEKAYADIFGEIAEAVNAEGFFNMKMTKKQLEERTSNSFMTMNLEDIVRPSVEKAITEITAKEIMSTMA